MKKPMSLRKYLVENIAFLRDNPDKLKIHIVEGGYRSRFTKGYSFESICPVRFVIEDFTDEPDIVAHLLFQWIRTNQSELMTNIEKDKPTFKFEAEIIDNDKTDVLFELELTERVIIKQNDSGTFFFDYPDEPLYTESSPYTQCELFDNEGKLVATWQSVEQQNTVALEMPLPGKRNGT